MVAALAAPLAVLTLFFAPGLRGLARAITPLAALPALAAAALAIGGAGRAMPVTFLALGLGGLSLMGLPPSGGFIAKWLLMKASIASGQWVWAMVMAVGGLLAGGYLYRVLAPALSGESPHLKTAPARSREGVALALAVVALLLAFAPQSFFAFLQIGRPAAGVALQ
jgi:formate hydrogenlyase subunit 3/multisubunit Na+/H+ antiporter MnhD subunit